MPAFAVLSDLQARWQGMPADAVTQATATALLGDASFWLRQWFPTEAAKIDANQVDGTGAKILVCTMVKRAMRNADNEGVSSASQGMGPFSESRVYSNPDGDLYITRNEATLIKGGNRVRSVRMTGTGPETRSYPHYGAIDQFAPSLWPQAYPNL